MKQQNHSSHAAGGSSNKQSNSQSNPGGGGAQGSSGKPTATKDASSRTQGGGKRNRNSNVTTLMPGKIVQPNTQHTNTSLNKLSGGNKMGGLASGAKGQLGTGGAQQLSSGGGGHPGHSRHGSTAGGASSGGANTELLEVTVIPVDEAPYNKHVQIPLIASSASGSNGTSLAGGLRSGTSGSLHANSLQSAQQAGVQGMNGQAMGGVASSQQLSQYPSLKDLFQNSDSLWRPIFGSFVGTNKKPQFAIFRKPIERRGDIKGIKKDAELSLHILYLKRDITQFPRNAFANQIEVYCSKFFYGPLVVVFCDTKAPYKLHHFPPYYLIEEIEPLNELEQKCYPLPFGAKRCSLVRALMSEERFTHNLDSLERLLTNHEFMLYCYKTSFCPISNSTIHDWSKCNYAHRQQDFRRPPYMFFYYPERCPHIGEDGSWDACEYELQCDYAHTLVEILFNPLHYKLADCADRSPTDKFKCAKHKERCCHAHSEDEKKMCSEVLVDQLVPKEVLPHNYSPKDDIMQYYIEMLPDYQQGVVNDDEEAVVNNDFDHGSTVKPQVSYQSSAQGSTSSTGVSTLAPLQKSISTSNPNHGSTAQRLSPFEQQLIAAAASAPPTKKTSSQTLQAQQVQQQNALAAAMSAPPSKAAANLQEASDLERQKFMETFQQMQKGMPTATSQKPSASSTFKVKTDPVAQAPLNPFGKKQAMVVSPAVTQDDSPLQVSESVGNVAEQSDFRPFDALVGQAVQTTVAPNTTQGAKAASIFDKLGEPSMAQPTLRPGQLIHQQMQAANLSSQMKVTTASTKIDQRVARKKGKLVKYVVSTTPAVTNTKSDQVEESKEQQMHQASEAAKLRSPNLAGSQGVDQYGRVENGPPSTFVDTLQKQKQGAIEETKQQSQLSQFSGPSRDSSQLTTPRTSQRHSRSPSSTSSPTASVAKKPLSSSKQALKKALLQNAAKAAAAAQDQQNQGEGLLKSTDKSTAAGRRGGKQAALKAAAKTSSVAKQTHNSRGETPSKETLNRKGQGGGGTLTAKQQTNQTGTSRLKKGQNAASIIDTRAPGSQQRGTLKDNRTGAAGELADQELPQSAQESAEADLKMVKQQLLQLQMKSLSLSEEDTERFYLQQIGENSNLARQGSTNQSSHLVPLLKSRSVSPQSRSDSDLNQTEEHIAAVEETKEVAGGARPARLKGKPPRASSPSNNRPTTGHQDPTTQQTTTSSMTAASDHAPNNKDPQQKQVDSCNAAAEQPPSAHQRLLPVRVSVLRQLAQDYSIIEVPDFYETVSMRLIVLGLSELRRLRPRPRPRDGPPSPRQENQRKNHNNRRSLQREEEEADEWTLQTRVSNAGLQHQLLGAAPAGREAPDAPQTCLPPPMMTLDLYQARTSSSSSDRRPSQGIATMAPQYLEALQRLQVTQHNRRSKAAPKSWLHAFPWTVFADPLFAWSGGVDADVVLQPAVARHHRMVAALGATDTVPAIMRHIWALTPLATSEGFYEGGASGGRGSGVGGGAESSRFTNKNNSNKKKARGESAGGPSASININNTNNTINYNPQIYKKGNKNSKMSNQARNNQFQSSDLSEQYKKA